jgi:hypothetical protein
MPQDFCKLSIPYFCSYDGFDVESSDFLPLRRGWGNFRRGPAFLAL